MEILSILLILQSMLLVVSGIASSSTPNTVFDFETENKPIG